MDGLAHAWPQLVVLAEVAGAMLLGGMIGYERETANKPAGFRTHMMVAGACALLVGLGGAMLMSFSRLHPGVISADPFRLVGGVVTALGFIGAGTIFRPQGQRVEGLTTATSLLSLEGSVFAPHCNSGGLRSERLCSRFSCCAGCKILKLESKQSLRATKNDGIRRDGFVTFWYRFCSQRELAFNR